jgi:hypothetical protein
MTEQEWLHCDHPYHLLDYLRRRAASRPELAGARKRRLLACAFCRTTWGLLTEERRAAVELAEHYADGETSEEALHAAWREAEQRLKEARRALGRWRGSGPGALEPLGEARQWMMLYNTVLAAEAVAALVRPDQTWEDLVTVRDKLWQLLLYSGAFAGLGESERTWAPLVRDVFGNPFRPVRLDPAWQTPEVVRLAQAVYQERAFARLPELADALQKVHCTELALVGHCLGRRVHARGCWALDLLLENA